MTYTDAVQLLDGTDSPIVNVVGRLAGIGAAAVTTASAGTVDFFALRDELVRWGNNVVGTLRERVRGLHRLDRTERLVAAHAVLVVTAFYQALEESLKEHPDFDLHLARLTRPEQVSLATGTWPGHTYSQLINALMNSPLPIPAAHRPFEQTVSELDEFYRNLARSLRDFLQGLSAYAGRSREVDELFQSMRSQLIALSVQRYRAGYLTLAGQVPEFAVWTAQVDAQATRALFRATSSELGERLTNLAVSMQGIAQLLGDMGTGAVVDQQRGHLALRYRTALDRPVLSSAQAPAHVILPTLAEGYVNPRGRVATAGRNDLPATESWWHDKPELADLQAFMAGHLTSPIATGIPLVLLGQPGSGKSALTKVLAGRLPAADFVVVRVELRAVPSDQSIQRQIEEAMYQTLGARVGWSDLRQRAETALLVVLLDGFDELLQATGLNHADYLERVQEFQEREAELGRPVAVVVTSRIVVADRMRFPDGTVVVRLEPFDEAQAQQWLAIWNRANTPRLAARSLLPLQLDAVWAHRELACQPLLLLLLALYDAGDNALQRLEAGIGRVELYTRLFDDFAAREVDKHASWQTGSTRRSAIEAEWRRLSAVAVAMLNRGSDVITEADLEADLSSLLSPEDLVLDTATSTSRALTAGQLLTGRFFFIHESQATRDTGAPERSFEFLHATFGEFLAARRIIDALVDLAEEREQRLRRRHSSFDAGYFYALASFATITRRGPLRDFCHGLLARLNDGDRQKCRELVVALFIDSGHAHPTWSYSGYEPVRRPVAARHAAFSANLLWLAVALATTPVDVAELVGTPAVVHWRQQALLWQSQLPSEDRLQLWQNFRVAWRREDLGSRLEIRLEDHTDVSLYESLPWPPDESAAVFQPDQTLAPDLIVPSHTDIGRGLRRSAFVQTANDVREHLYAMAPYWQTFGDVRELTQHGHPVTDARVLLQLLLTQSTDVGAQQRIDLFHTAFGASSHPFYHQLVGRALLHAAIHLPVGLLTWTTSASLSPSQIGHALGALDAAITGMANVLQAVDADTADYNGDHEEWAAAIGSPPEHLARLLESWTSLDRRFGPSRLPPR